MGEVLVLILIRQVIILLLSPKIILDKMYKIWYNSINKMKERINESIS